VRFTDRAQAARELAVALAPLRGQRPLVLAIPRGAVPMARDLATALDGDLDVVLARKLGHPLAPEVAVGAVDEAGHVVLADDPFGSPLPDDVLAELVARETARIRARRAALTPVRGPVDPAGRTVVVVDDGAATGSTMVAALDSLRGRGAARLVAALPVAAPAAATRIRAHADDAVILHEPPGFTAVGACYDDFDEVTDARVLEVLGCGGTEMAHGRR
jgi:predicted phosphoribosyltransferase